MHTVARSESSTVERVRAMTGSPDKFRNVFYTVLSSEQQRACFYRVMRDAKNWPSTTALFGSPPYQFLRQTDRDPVRASAVKKGARRLCYTTRGLRRSGAPHYTSGSTGVRVLSARSGASQGDSPPPFLLRRDDDVVLELHVSRETDRLSKRISLTPVRTLSEMFPVAAATVLVKTVLVAARGVVLVAARVD